MKPFRSLAFILLGLHASLAAPAPSAKLDEKQRTFLKDYCIECHNEEKQKTPSS